MENSDWKHMGNCIRNRDFFLLPSADVDLLHTQLFGEIAGNIHLFFCWAPSKPCGLITSASLWSLPCSATWETSLSRIECFLLIITQKKIQLCIIHSFFWSLWQHLHLTPKNRPESVFTDLHQIWLSPDEKYNFRNETIFSFFPSSG